MEEIYIYFYVEKVKKRDGKKVNEHFYNA